MMGLHIFSKQTAWCYSGTRGKRISKKQCRKYERRKEKDILKVIKKDFNNGI